LDGNHVIRRKNVLLKTIQIALIVVAQVLQVILLNLLLGPALELLLEKWVREEVTPT
jgi:hypothetical protein